MKYKLFIAIILCLFIGAGIVLFILRSHSQTPVDISRWSGTWVSADATPDIYGIVTVQTTSSPPGQLHFTLEAFYGANMGNIDATATLAKSGEEARAHIVDGNNVCDVTLLHPNEIITVSTTEQCGYYAGMSVTFDNDYIKDKPVPTSSVKDLLALSTPALQKSFTDLVGDDLDSFLVGTMDQEETDLLDPNLPGTAYSGSAYGLYGIVDNLVLAVQPNYIWAVVLDEKSGYARYYTNVPEYYHKVPKTIKRWLTEHGAEAEYEQ